MLRPIAGITLENVGYHRGLAEHPGCARSGKRPVLPSIARTLNRNADGLAAHHTTWVAGLPTRTNALVEPAHSFSKGLVDLYQSVIADPMNGGVSSVRDMSTLTGRR
jgi:hypothetical protein